MTVITLLSWVPVVLLVAGILFVETRQFRRSKLLPTGSLTPLMVGSSSGFAATCPRAGRNVAQVFLGVLGGLWLGVIFIGVLLLTVPRERRADRLFGGWIGTIAGSGLLVAAIVASTG